MSVICYSGGRLVDILCWLLKCCVDSARNHATFLSAPTTCQPQDTHIVAWTWGLLLPRAQFVGRCLSYVTALRLLPLWAARHAISNYSLRARTQVCGSDRCRVPDTCCRHPNIELRVLFAFVPCKCVCDVGATTTTPPPPSWQIHSFIQNLNHQFSP